MILSVLIIIILKTTVNNRYIYGQRNALLLVSIWYNIKSQIGFFINVFLFAIITAIIFMLTMVKKLLFNEHLKTFIKDNFSAIKGIIILPFLYFILSYIIADVIYIIFDICMSSFNDSNWIKELWEFLERGFDIDFIGLFKLILVFLIFAKLNIKNAVRLGKIINITKSIADSGTETLIEDDKNDYLGLISNNINKIINNFRTLSKNEKNAQNTKNELITNVSHDLRTPLTSIIGYLSLVDEDKYKDEVELRYYISIAYEKAKRLNILINDLFELTKMNNNYVKLRLSDIDIGEFLGQITAQSEYMIKKSNMEIRLKMCSEKMIVSGDGNKLLRVFENLISNSIKYGSEGKYLDVLLEKEQDMAVIKIINYGEEILSSDLPYIFDRFYRIEKSRNSSRGGSGLGLSIAKGIVELHKGKIRALSDSEKTTFEVRLPLKMS